MSNNRPSWNTYFMSLAQLVATRATCPRRHVGAVLVKDKRILATGYNGSPPGSPHCSEAGCIMETDEKCIRTIHAEQNVILQAAIHGISIEGATLYCTSRPCAVCSRIIAGSKIKEIVYLGVGPSGLSYDDLVAANIQLTQYKEDNA